MTLLTVLVGTSAILATVRALPRPNPNLISSPTVRRAARTITGRQTLITNINGTTTTIQNKGPSKAMTIGVTVAVIIGFVLVISLGIWWGKRRRRANQEWRKSMVLPPPTTVPGTPMGDKRPMAHRQTSTPSSSAPGTPAASIAPTLKYGTNSQPGSPATQHQAFLPHHPSPMRTPVEIVVDEPQQQPRQASFPPPSHHQNQQTPRQNTYPPPTSPQEHLSRVVSPPAGSAASHSSGSASYHTTAAQSFLEGPSSGEDRPRPKSTQSRKSFRGFFSRGVALPGVRESMDTSETSIAPHAM